MLTTEKYTVRPDTKGRISLGKLAQGVSSFHVTVDSDHRIILEPYSEIPSREAWIFADKAALAKVQKGLQESAEGQLHDLGSFASFAEEGEE